MRSAIPLLFLFGIFLVAGCSGDEERAVGQRLDDKGVREVLSEASRDEYTPPPDGRLTRDQIEMYLKVREREQEIARVARERVEDGAEKLKNEERSLSGILEGVKSLGSAADFLTADIRAAQELGYNTAEYEWAKARILDAATSVMREKVAAATRARIDEKAEDLRRRMNETDNETERNTYARLLETYEKSRPSGDEKVDEALLYNRQLLSDYEDSLDTLGVELSKWETREGAAAEKIQELDRDLEALAGAQRD